MKFFCKLSWILQNISTTDLKIWDFFWKRLLLHQRILLNHYCFFWYSLKIVFSLNKSATSMRLKILVIYEEKLQFFRKFSNYGRKSVFVREKFVFSLNVWLKWHRYSANSQKNQRRILENLWKSPKTSGKSISETLREIFSLGYRWWNCIIDLMNAKRSWTLVLIIHFRFFDGKNWIKGG